MYIPDSISILEKPIAFESKPYLYFMVSPKEFEELIYELANQEIEYGKGELNRNFNSAGWLDKPGDRGRDILLFKDGKSAGVIQCKHSKSNDKKFSKAECIDEIIKFILHYILDKNLIYDLDIFTYYFSVSSGFKEDAILYLEDFGFNVSNDQDIEKRIRKVVAENKDIKTHLDIDFHEIKSTLSKLHVKRLDSVRLDTWLNREYNQNIVKRHFKVKEIISTQKEQTFQSEIPIQEISENIKAASHSLLGYTNFFYGIPDSHIERKETNQILGWIKEPLQEKEAPLAILVGSPGIGKSVVLKDLLEKLEKEGILFIGIKADLYYTEDKADLEKKLGLFDSFEKLIRTIIANYGKAVVIIDQLDALSLSLSGKREHLMTYHTLIHQLIRISNLRIVMSIRRFDLDTDSDFTFLKKYKQFPLGKLSKPEIETVLKKLNPCPEINELLYGLLASPYNLNAFVKIYSSTLNLNSLRSSGDLYKELWTLKIITQNKSPNIQAGRLKELLYSIAFQMHDKQMIAMSSEIFIDDYFKEIEYLCKEGILSRSNSSIQFFHQTFYDFVFAKQFCEEGQSILKYVRNRWQSLGIRSMVKMVFSFLRETKHNEYIDILSKFLFNKKNRFHLQLLIIQILASEQSPTDSECDFVRRKIIKSKKYRTLFIESIRTTKWLQFVISEGIIEDLEDASNSVIDNAIGLIPIKLRILTLDKVGYTTFTVKTEKNHQLWRSLFLRMLPDGRDDILQYITEAEFLGKSDFIRRILYFLKIWDNPKAFILYNEYILTFDENGFDSYKMVEDAIPYNIDWVISKCKESLVHRILASENNILRSNFKFNHSDIGLLNKLYNQNQFKAFNLNLEVVLLLIEKSKYNIPYRYGDLWIDHAFHDSTFDEKNDYQFLFCKLGEELQSLSKASSIFKEFINRNIDTNYESVIRLLIYGLIANPEQYINEILALFVKLHGRNLLNEDNSWHYYLRKLIGKSYPYFTQIQKNKINHILLSIRYSKEYRIRENSETGHKRVVSFYNHLSYKYLLSIPENEIKQQKELYKKYQECQRRYKNVNDEEPHRVRVHTVGPPLNGKAYQFMSLKQWRKSFLKYNSDMLRDFVSNKGGITEHARAFETEIKKRPAFFIHFIEKIVDDKDIDITYIVYGIRGLIEVKYDFEKVRLIFKKTIKDREVTDYHMTYLIWNVDYFIENEYMDDEVFDFIVKASLYGEFPDRIYNPTDLVFDGINSTRGAAVERLIQITYKPEYSNRIFETVLKVAEDKMDSVKAAVLSQLAYLNHYDEQLAFKIFQKLINTDNEQLLKSSLWSVSYFKTNFYSELIPYFRKLMSYEALVEDLATILAISWLEEIKGSQELLEELLQKSGKARNRMIYIVEVNMFHEEKLIREKCLTLFNRYLNDKTKEMAEEYSHLFLRLSPEKFELLLPSIEQYSKSNVCKNNPFYFLEYLFKCTGKYPIQCLDLLRNINILQGLVNDDNRYHNNEALNVIVGAYNALLKEKEKNKKQIIRSVTLFDQYLKDRRFRQEAEKVLVQNDTE